MVPLVATATSSDPDLLAILQECLGNLNPDYRTVLLGFAEGSSYDEMAELHKVPMNTIKSRLFRGREDLKHCLGPYAE